MRTYVLIGKTKRKGGVSWPGVGLKGSVAVLQRTDERKKSLDHHLKNETRLHQYTCEDHLCGTRGDPMLYLMSIPVTACKEPFLVHRWLA